MTHTIMNEQDNERKVWYLKELKRIGMTDEELTWLYKNATLSIISNLHSYQNRCIRFDYWFNVIKDVNVASDVLTVINISNIDCSPVEVSKHHAYKPGPYSKALNTLHGSGDMTSRNLLRFLDLVRLTYNHTHVRIRNGKYINKYKKPTTCFPTISHKVSSTFGKRSRGDYHTGIDLCGKYGDDIYAYKSGKVIKVQYSNVSYGNMVLIEHNDGTKTRYAHMSSIIVSNGQYVDCGQRIGYMGSTGNSTGNHLHFEIIINNKAVNPYSYIF